MGPRVLGNSPSNVESIARTPVTPRSLAPPGLLLSRPIARPLSRSSAPSSLLSFQPYERNPVLPPSVANIVPSYTLASASGTHDVAVKFQNPRKVVRPTAPPPPASSHLARTARVPPAASGNEGAGHRGTTFLPKSRRLSVLSWKFQESLKARREEEGITRMEVPGQLLGILIISRPWKR